MLSKLLLLLAIAIEIASLALAHAPPDVSSPGASGGGSCPSVTTSTRAGMGGLGRDENDSAMILRRQCTEDYLTQDRALTCSGLFDDRPTSSEAFRSGVEATTLTYLRSYLAGVLYDEVNITVGHLTSSGDSQYRFLQGMMRPPCATRPAPHASARRTHYERDNMISATVLGVMYGIPNGSRYTAESTSSEYTPYTQRLKRSYPHLFMPRNRSSGVVDVLRRHLGSGFNPDRNSSTTHNDIMQAYNALASSNATFRNEIDAALNESIYGYLQYDNGAEAGARSSSTIRVDAHGACDMSLSDIMSKYPGIFDQALIDADESQRAVMNTHLCAQSSYYNPANYDTDCDGRKDNVDSEPNNPFSPTSSFTRRGTSTDNPPYVSSYNYSVDYNDSTHRVGLATSLTFNASGLSTAQQRQFSTAVSSCRGQINTSLTTAFNSLRGQVSFLGRSARLVPNITLNVETTPPTSSDFAVHQCYCTDCHIIDPDQSQASGPRYIPRETCFSALTPTQVAAVEASDATRTAAQTWRDRADAANLLPTSSCHTIAHEVFHRLGLPDEYMDARIYPFNRLGCNIMGEGNTMALEPRHIRRILSPKQCSI